MGHSIDREKVIKGLECHADRTNLSCRPSKCPYFAFDFCGPLLATDAIELLKEQQQQIWEFQDQVEYLTDKQKEQKFLVDSDGRITPLPVVVRCKDCKHKEKDGISEGVHYCNVNGLQVTDDWFCADGERKEGR